MDTFDYANKFEIVYDKGMIGESQPVPSFFSPAIILSILIFIILILGYSIYRIKKKDDGSYTIGSKV